MTKKVKLYGIIISFLTCLLFTASQSFGQEIKGKVTDNITGESLIDATVTLMNASKTYSAKTGLDGSFHFKNIPSGSYTEIIHFLGYDASSLHIEVRNGYVVNNDIRLKLHISELGEVTVNSNGERESDRSARKREKSANNLVNIISANAIEISPDLTVGNVMQRAAGVSVVKNSSGDGQYAIIRGMADRYNYTTVNGIKIPSPDGKTRSIPLDIFPSDLLEKLEIVKSLTPSMEGDAIGGVTNMILKDAPRHLVYSLNGSLGYNNYFDNHDFTTFSHQGVPFRTPYEIHGPGYVPQPSDFNVKYLDYTHVKLPVNEMVNASVGNYISKKFGFLAAVSYQHIYNGSSSLFYPPGGQPQPIPAPNTPVFAPIEYRTYSNLQNRLGTHLKLNYDINPNNKISFYAAYFQLDQSQHRNLEQGLANYLHQSGQDYINDRSLFERQIIWNNTLQGKHQLSKRFSVDWSLVYSQAQSEVPVWIDQLYSDIVTYDQKSVLTSEQKNLQDFPFNFTHSKEIDHSAYLNANYKINDEFVFSMGGMYRHKTKDNVFESYELYANNQPFTTIDAAYFERLKRVDTTDGLTYQSIENILAYYAQFSWTYQRWEMLGGLRIENTNHSYNSELSIYLPGKTGDYFYSDFLPSLNVKYKLSDNKDLRASYFKSISRPNYFEYIPVIKAGDFFDEQGNPDIKHVQADNYDLRYEQYFGSEDYVMAGTFYKKIVNPIEYALIQISTGQFVYQPQNFGNAENYGAEFIFTKHFRNFGITGNYAYTKSSITTSKTVFAEDKSGNYIKYNTTQTRPLQGQSDHIANLSLLYKSVRKGIDAQLSWVYTGKRIEYISPYLDLDYWQRATSVLDFSIEVKTGRRITLFGKVTNLTNNPTVLELHNTANGYYFHNKNYPGQTSKNSIIVQTNVFNQSFIIGFRLK
ncbi:MAG TPA: TonB-dependent receptor [Chitinophagaceae bacterium]|nr:TonB-dependent receptor [Chitinophagaceae bacterium]